MTVEEFQIQNKPDSESINSIYYLATYTVGRTYIAIYNYYGKYKFITGGTLGIVPPGAHDVFFPYDNNDPAYEFRDFLPAYQHALTWQPAL